MRVCNESRQVERKQKRWLCDRAKVGNREDEGDGCENKAQKPKRQGSSEAIESWQNEWCFWSVMDGCRSRTLQLNAQAGRRRILQVVLRFIAERCGFQGCGTLCLCCHGQPRGSWLLLSHAFCFRASGLGWRDGEGRARVPVPAADEQGQVHLPLCLRGECRLNAQKRMQGLVGAKTLADGFDAKDDAIQKNGQEANQGLMQKEWAIDFPGCSPSPGLFGLPFPPRNELRTGSCADWSVPLGRYAVPDLMRRIPVAVAANGGQPPTGDNSRYSSSACPLAQSRETSTESTLVTQGGR
ncbi:hypothetical protein B0T13DRAFT_173059 [Neurospora crassa]|nr:hypothetical protein B0T13DRAFT_173059 [Neurospora crassa]